VRQVRGRPAPIVEEAGGRWRHTASKKNVLHTARAQGRGDGGVVQQGTFGELSSGGPHCSDQCLSTSDRGPRRGAGHEADPSLVTSFAAAFAAATHTQERPDPTTPGPARPSRARDRQAAPWRGSRGVIHRRPTDRRIGPMPGSRRPDRIGVVTRREVEQARDRSSSFAQETIVASRARRAERRSTGPARAASTAARLPGGTPGR